MKFHQLVAVVNGEPLASTEIIAKGVGVQHKNVLALVRCHAGLLDEFGRVAFQTRPFATRGGQQYREVALLNERQTTLLLTLMRNSPKVAAFKVALIKYTGQKSISPANTSLLERSCLMPEASLQPPHNQPSLLLYTNVRYA